jgi:CDP-diglyceride synthetase
MTSRILTGAALFALLLVALYFGGLVFSILWIACVCIALYEVFHTLSHVGHRPAAWPTWVALIIAIPGFMLLPEIGGLLLLVILVVVTLFLTSVLVMFGRNARDEPAGDDQNKPPGFPAHLSGACLFYPSHG